jgi:Fur family transcriptional regulator, ferric uptake regulator
MNAPQHHSSHPSHDVAIEDLYATLRERFPRLTKGKKAVVEQLFYEHKPLTAHEIFAGVAQSNKGAVKETEIDLATIYRNLEQLERANVVVKIEYSTGGWKYALAGATHSHNIQCVQCGKEVAMNECMLADVERIIAEKTGFTGIHHTVNFTGSCPACQSLSKEHGHNK